VAPSCSGPLPTSPCWHHVCCSERQCPG